MLHNDTSHHADPPRQADVGLPEVVGRQVSVSNEPQDRLALANGRFWRDHGRVSARFTLLALTLVASGCLAVAGVGDYKVDDCFGGCSDGEALDTSAKPDVVIPPHDASDSSASDVHAPLEAEADAPPLLSPGLSNIILSSAGMAVGRSVVATLIARNNIGDQVARTGAVVRFTTTPLAQPPYSVVSIGAITDMGDGTYEALITGVTEGSRITINATIDGAPLKAPPPSLRVVNRVNTGEGLTFELDADNADNNGNPGNKTCTSTGLPIWIDLVNFKQGTLTGFASLCGSPSGWDGTGKLGHPGRLNDPPDPYHLTFDGDADHVAFGAINSLQPSYTVLAWVRKTGPGTEASSGPGGLPSTFPIVAKGSPEAESENLDINYYLSITPAGRLASDFETTPGSSNNPLVSSRELDDNTWYMLGMTLDNFTRTLYINGIADTSASNSATPASGAQSQLVIGGANRSNGLPSGRFKGDVAVVLTYNRALTASEIRSNCLSYSYRFWMKCD